MPTRDPIRLAKRRKLSQLRVGKGSVCGGCGESSPHALMPGIKPILCAECQRHQTGKSIYDLHHVAGRANHELTIPVRVNAHRSVLSAAQYDWPRRTLRNPDRSPLLAAAACIRGFVDMIEYLLELIGWIPAQLESVDGFLTRHFGPAWPKAVQQEKAKHDDQE